MGSDLEIKLASVIDSVEALGRQRLEGCPPQLEDNIILEPTNIELSLELTECRPVQAEGWTWRWGTMAEDSPGKFQRGAIKIEGGLMGTPEIVLKSPKGDCYSME